MVIKLLPFAPLPTGYKSQPFSTLRFPKMKHHPPNTQ